MNKQALDLKEIYQKTTQAQSEASNPQNSVFVSANAGTGKTHILVNRVLRLLLSGSEPFRILCLTYTNAAAAEMENRLFSVLSTWVTMEQSKLQNILEELLKRPPKEDEIADARRLFAKTIETPGGMKVQTIHSFAEKLLQRFPLEADVPPHFKMLDDTTASELLKKSIAAILKKAMEQKQNEGQKVLGKALSNLVTHATDTQFEKLILSALRQKTSLAPVAGESQELKSALSRILQLPETTSEDHWQKAMAGAVADELILSISPLLLETAKTTDLTLLENFSVVKGAKSESLRIEALKRAFLTKDNTPKKRLVTKAITDKEPALVDQLILAQDNFYEAFGAYEKLQIAKATESLHILADKIIQHYEEQKIERAALDFQDLIEKTGELLSSRATTSWVHFKLDQGIDHILVDEAQDTSPEQWKIIARLAEEFFAGLTPDKRLQTIFAVGDEKQSIYGFQGAKPRQFREMGSHFKKGAELAEKPFKEIPLNLSFRSTSAVLDAVDYVFENPQRSQSLTFGNVEIAHYANRALSPGLVEIWPTETTATQEKIPAFTPLDEANTNRASERCAQKIAKKIRKWLDEEEVLASKQRPIKPGDILILVRKRASFAPEMIRALKRENIPVAGADRIIITEQLAVMDMMALGQFLSLPEDDLSLASVLKSPIFNLTDDDLFQLCNKRKGSLWQSLRYFAKRENKYQNIASQLSLWLARADILPPFEFFANLLEGEGLRQKFISRLGAVAGDALDEFLNLALTYDEQEPPSLEGFLNWLRRSKAEIKRDMEKGQNQVRVMTVHGAKGLEADIVFLPDTCSTRSASQSESLIPIKDPAKPENAPDGKTLLWSLAGKNHLEVLKEGRETTKRGETEEQMRLLYVALTRARDRLYITGFETTKGRDKNCWYDIISESIEPHTIETRDPDIGLIKQLQTGETQKTTKDQEKSHEKSEVQPLPAWAETMAEHEPVRTIPVAPSSVIPYETPDDDEDKLPIEPAVMSPNNLGHEGRFLRGRLVHKLLEYLPNVARKDREKVAQTLAKSHGRELRETARKAIIKETFAILDHPDYQDLFAPGSRAEVNLIAKIIPNGVSENSKSAKPILLSGQIDRLVVRDNEILIVDYKSNRPSPRKLEDVAEAYQAQLAAYRIALRAIYPNHRTKAALLWTDGPYFMEIPDKMLDKYEAILNKKAQ